MVALKKLIAPVLAGAALAFGSASAFALNSGDSGTFSEMQTKLANEGQVEIVNAATGTSQNLRGIKFYYNQSSRVEYIALTDDPIRPTQMRIVLKVDNTDFAGPVVVPQPQAGIQECEQLVAQQRVKPNTCGSLYSVLKVAQDRGLVFFQQGKLANGNTLITVLNASNNEGIVYESTPNGATLTKLALGATKYTPEGTRIVAASNTQRKIASLVPDVPKMP